MCPGLPHSLLQHCHLLSGQVVNRQFDDAALRQRIGDYRSTIEWIGIVLPQVKVLRHRTALRFN